MQWDMKNLPPELTNNLGLFLIGWLVFLVICLSITCILTYKLAKKKGYRGYFWTGFFLQMIGLIYVVGLPTKHRRKAEP